MVSGIKSTKEDWLKGTSEEKRIPEANQEIGKIITYLFNFYFTSLLLCHVLAGLYLGNYCEVLFSFIFIFIYFIFFLPFSSTSPHHSVSGHCFSV